MWVKQLSITHGTMTKHIRSQSECLLIYKGITLISNTILKSATQECCLVHLPTHLCFSIRFACSYNYLRQIHSKVPKEITFRHSIDAYNYINCHFVVSLKWNYIGYIKQLSVGQSIQFYYKYSNSSIAGSLQRPLFFHTPTENVSEWQDYLTKSDLRIMKWQ